MENLLNMSPQSIYFLGFYKVWFSKFKQNFVEICQELQEQQDFFFFL